MKKKILLTLLILALIVGGYYFFIKDAEQNNGNMVDLNTYTDEGLGFQFDYPEDWNQSLSEDNTLNQQRQEKIVLQKNGIRILVDPLGRLGSDQFSSPVETENVNINSIEWVHTFWPEGNYHRYRASEDAIKLKIDSSTDGSPSAATFNQPYTTRRSFRIHLYLEDATGINSEEEAVETINTILNSLAVL